mgnify:CR=1 FL=1|jgi:hypothetical protein
MAHVDAHLSLLLATPEVVRLIAARPHVYPPNVNPPFDYPFQYVNGVATSPRSDATAMTNKIWKNNRCGIVDWCLIIVEFALAGVRQSQLHGGPATLNICAGSWENCFSNCMVCWRTQQRDFSDADKTSHPYSVSIHNPVTPQLGCCGCVICTQCLTEEFARRPDDNIIACPYCAQLKSYSRDVKAWILCEAVCKTFLA